ncbi:hypothetical protein HYPSUDRAFT_63831 [Hypholoma sublateritium FD-334 SS-4]|uniref:MARVEL domain-containing protein n=1 Tax=Hypholoma sublateritium (strain FD-334 SS-4) TaxID=945553 RepID=A0A0D2MRE4_HYPSF|nr:hypothetical protein HYPSUDRAFT_63831 [Hypholoma sublateritium FD-334 SS-4]
MSLYAALVFWSFVLFCLSAARLGYTTHLPRGDPLNNGHSFYDPIVVEILFTTLITIPWAVVMIMSIHKRWEHPVYSTFVAEIVGLSVLWVFWIVGAGGATHPWGALGFCQQFNACRVLSALVAFAWLGWLTLSLLLAFSLLFSIANKAAREPLHGRWNPRASGVGGASVVRA